MTEKILRQSREAESALADALKSPRKRSTGPFEGLGFGDNSDESETSSLCSEKSFDYGRGRPSDLGVWLGSRERLYGQNWDTVAIQDITDIIANCASTHWADRKDGLIGLQSYFREG